ncbi:MAG: T9SS type A sorting domain-containing protein [Bacteroidetes bacterium]|nr:T9SS type A sorting domain-containing protein [Bacteroidota bacterium]
MKKITLIFALFGFLAVSAQDAKPALSYLEARSAELNQNFSLLSANVTQTLDHSFSVQDPRVRPIIGSNQGNSANRAQNVLSQSIDNMTLGGGTVACGSAAGYTTENSWFRTYVPRDFGLTGEIQLDGVEFAYTYTDNGGSGNAIGGFVRAWTSDEAFPGGTYELVAEGAISLDAAGADVKTFFPFDATAVVGDRTEVIVEVFVETGADDLIQIRIYDNDLGENAPSYLASASCGITTPTAMEDINSDFVDNDIILDLVATDFPLVVIDFDPSANYVGFANVFQTPANGGGYVFGSPWGVSDLKTVVDPASSVTLQPNFNTYNAGDTFWTDPVTLLGNKVFEANTYIQDNSLVGNRLRWRGLVTSNDLELGQEEEIEVITISSDNQSGDSGFTDFSVIVTEPTTISFDWSYTTTDGPEFDSFGYVVNGDYTILTDPEGALNQQGNSGSIDLVIGDTFSFRSFSEDGLFGAATTTVSNFVPGFEGQFDQSNWVEVLNNSDGSASFNVIPFIPGYEAMAFIKVFNADFSYAKVVTAPLVEGEYFEVNYSNVEATDAVIQYGWYVKGLNADPTTESALGSVVIGAGNCGDFDYVNNLPTGGGPPSQIFGDFPGFTSLAADDVFFTSSAGTICSIRIDGRYRTDYPGLPGDPNGTIELTIYNDDNGEPGSVRYEESFPGSIDSDGDGDFYLYPSEPLEATLNPNTRYWVSVAVQMEFTLGGQWYWSSAEDSNDEAALWQNPGGGFGVCPTWGTFADCEVGGGFGPDLMMEITFTETDSVDYDYCFEARPITCGDTVTGDTLSATVEAGLTDCGTSITAPGVWYVFEDNSGLASEVLLSTCNQADYDTKLYVFTGSCGDLICIDGNDDTTGCSGFTTELEFLSDGNSTYYILVAGYSSSTGNFDLSMECTLIPPPNNDIVDAIDLLTVGCPFTDEAVAMPAATEEAGTPAGCDISGAAGVWYEFTPEINGFITGTIGSPAGISSVTFYTAPDQSSGETDLVHVDYYQNQCLPGSSATIPVIGGQTYYCFVVNTGGITDIIFDNCQLGTASNEIEGFEFYPNPTRERINLAAAQNIESVVLYNILGQKMLDINVDATTTELNVAHLSAGAYLMEVTVDGQTGTYKLIKQ